jgi:hypothetical protein
MTDNVKSMRVKQAEKKVDALLNYGGIHLDHAHSPGHLSLEYQQGDLLDEVGQMRDLAGALNELADALEERPVKSSAPKYQGPLAFFLSLLRDFLWPAVISAVVAMLFVFSSLFASGTRFDPRVAIGDYQAGNTLGTMFANGAEIMSMAMGQAPLVFVVAFVSISFAWVIVQAGSNRQRKE